MDLRTPSVQELSTLLRSTGGDRLNPLFPKSLVNKLEGAIIIFLLLTDAGFHASPRFLEILGSAGYTVFPLLFIFFHWKRMAYIVTKDIFLCCLMVMAIASVLWSSNPATTSFDIRFLVRATLLGIYLPIRYPPRELIHLLSWTTGIAMILSVGFGLLFPAYSIQHGGTAWIGVFGHKQGAGSYLGFTATLFTIHAFDKRSNRWRALAGLGLAMVLVLLSQSKAGLVLCLLPFMLMPLYKISKQGKYRAAMLITAFVISCLVAALIILNLETIVVGWLGKDLEFNGRLPIWILAIGKIFEQPWLGYGYHGFWTCDVSDSILFNTWLSLEEGFKTRTVIPNAHQGFIDLVIQLGFVGGALFFASFILLLKRVIDLVLITRSIEYFWMFLFLAYFLVINLVESVNILEQGNAWIIYVSVSLSSALEYSRLKKGQQVNLKNRMSSAST
jgi:exopolysaccharide production protein ExoQ